jgi:DNA-binding SARP family transcriptional activator
MRLYVLTGRRGAALRPYQACATVLERELRAGPRAETRTLYHQALNAKRWLEETDGLLAGPLTF